MFLVHSYLLGTYLRVELLETIKIPRRKHRGKPSLYWSLQCLLEYNAKSTGQKKGKIDKWDYIKLQTFSHSKGNKQTKNQRQPTQWKKIFANHLSDKELMARIYKTPTMQ